MWIRVHGSLFQPKMTERNLRLVLQLLVQLFAILLEHYSLRSIGNVLISLNKCNTIKFWMGFPQSSTPHCSVSSGGDLSKNGNTSSVELSESSSTLADGCFHKY